MAYNVKIKPAVLPRYQPVSQIPFELEVTVDEIWSVVPTYTVIEIELQESIDYEGSLTANGDQYTINNNIGGNGYSFDEFSVNTTYPKVTLNQFLGAFFSKPKNLHNFDAELIEGLNGSSCLLRITSKYIGYQSKEFSHDLNTAPSNFLFFLGGTGTLKPNFQLIYQLSTFNPFKPSQEIICHPQQGVFATSLQNSNNYEIFVDFSKIASNWLKGELPVEQCNVPVWGYNTGKMFKIRYGWSTKAAGEETRAFLIDAGSFFVMNQKLDLLDGVDKYATLSVTDGKIRFLNQKIDTQFGQSIHSIEYLNYFYSNTILALISAANFTVIGECFLSCSVVGYRVSNSPIFSVTNELSLNDLLGQPAGVAIFPIGIPQLDTGSTDLTKLDYIVVSLDFKNGQGDTKGLIEYIKIPIRHFCYEKEFYFQNRSGAFETIIAEELIDITSSVSQTNFNRVGKVRSFEKNGDYNKQVLRNADKGTQQYNTTSKRQYKVLFPYVAHNKENIDFIEGFLGSEERFVKRGYDIQTSTLFTDSFVVVHSERILDKKNKLIKFEIVIEVDSTQLV